MENNSVAPLSKEQYYKENPKLIMPWVSMVVGGSIYYSFSVKILECDNQTLIVGGVSDQFIPLKPNAWKIAGTDVFITDFMGTFELGLLYCSKAIQLEIGKYINITNKL